MMFSLHFRYIVISTVFIIQLSHAENKTCGNNLNGECQCEMPGLCVLECIGSEQCKGSNNYLKCMPGYPCLILCDGEKESCKGIQYIYVHIL